jgi:hypothetical protein
MDFTQRVDVDNNLKNLGIPLGRCDKNEFKPSCSGPPCDEIATLRKLTNTNSGFTYVPPTVCAPYHASAFQNNMPQPNTTVFKKENYEWKEK